MNMAGKRNIGERKRTSTRLEAFEADQLAALAQLYPTIRRELERIGELSEIRLPDVAEPERRLDVLRELEARGDLWIRISYAGNLNIGVRTGPELGEELGYLSVLRRPATDWCKPVGRYYPDELVGEDDEDDVSSDPIEAMERAQYRIAKIVADEIRGIDPAVARRIAERVVEQISRLWDPLD